MSNLLDPHGAQRRPPLAADPLVARLAARRDGVVSHRQLVEIGLSDRQIGRRVTAGHLHRLHRGVYAVGHPAVSRAGRIRAATLAVGGSVASHRSAAALHGFWRESIRLPEVTALRGHRPRRGLWLHETRSLPREDVTWVRGIPVTTVRRTLIDLADVLAPDAFERVLRHAERLRLIDRSELAPIRGRRGAGTIAARQREVLRSELERAFKRLLQSAGLPTPDFNAMWNGEEIDALWERERLAVELDGYSDHSSREAFRTDRRKDVRRLRAGLRSVRFTYYDVMEDADYVVETVSDLL